MNPLLIKYAIGAVVTALFGWLCYDYGHDSVMSEWQTERAEMASATTQAIIKLREQQDAIQRDLKAKESQSWELYQNAEKEAERLNGELNAMPWRVQVVTKPGNCGVPETDSASSVGDDTTGQYAELPIETTRSVIAIGKDADQCEAKLKALQDYVKIIVDGKKQ